MSEQYTILPEFYDRLNTEADYDSYVKYLLKHISRGASVLDLGCGTGEMSIALAKNGYDVTGLDISEEMLALAFDKSQRTRADVFYTCQDMSSFSVPTKFDSVISCFDSLNYLLTKDKLLSAFNCVANALKTNGLFLFDMNSPEKFTHFYANNTFVIEEDGIFCVWENDFNHKSSRCKFYINIFVDNGKSYDRYYEEQTERSFKYSDIVNCLKKSGFELVSVAGDFSGKEIDNNTQRFYFIVRKK